MERYYQVLPAHPKKLPSLSLCFCGLNWPMFPDLRKEIKGSVDLETTTHMHLDIILKFGILRVFYLLEYSCFQKCLGNA